MKSFKKVLSLTMCIGLLSSTLLLGCSNSDTNAQTSDEATSEETAQGTTAVETEELGTIPTVDVNFAIEPYPPHTVSIVAFNNGWFEEVGININWTDIDADKVSSVLIAGTADFASAAPCLLVPSMTQAEFQTFAFGDLFQAYAIVAQPDAGYKSYTEFLEEGNTPEEAMKLAMGQLKGKIFTYPSEAAIKPFIDVALDKGGLTYDDFTSDVQQDSNSTALMLSKRADFQVGGLASRLTLEQNGMIPIVTSLDLASSAQASPDDISVRTVQHDGWTTTKKYADENHETILRLASVRFRLNDYFTNNPEMAAEEHIPFLNKETGSDFSIEDGIGMYTSLMPMYTFEQQRAWFEEEDNPLYWSYEIDSNIKLYEEQGIFEEGQFTASDIVMADQIYAELDGYRIQAEANFAELADAEGQAAELRDIAQHQYDIFNYYDAARVSGQALSVK